LITLALVSNGCSSVTGFRQTDPSNWAAIAYDLGYSSQGHFITDFKQILGKTLRQSKKNLTKD